MARVVVVVVVVEVVKEEEEEEVVVVVVVVMWWGCVDGGVGACLHSGRVPPPSPVSIHW